MFSEDCSLRFIFRSRDIYLFSPSRLLAFQSKPTGEIWVILGVCSAVCSYYILACITHVHMLHLLDLTVPTLHTHKFSSRSHTCCKVPLLDSGVWLLFTQLAGLRKFHELESRFKSVKVTCQTLLVLLGSDRRSLVGRRERIRCNITEML